MEISGKLSGDVFLLLHGSEKARLLKFIFESEYEGDLSRLRITAHNENHNQTIELVGDPRHVSNTLRHIADQISSAINS